MGFSRQEYWSGLPFPSWGYLPNPGVKPRSPALQVDSLPSEPSGKPTCEYIASCESSQNKRFMCVLSYFCCVWPFVALWTVACQAPLSMGFFRQESWSGLSCCSPGDLLDPGIEPTSPALQVDSLPSEPSSNPTLSFWAVLHQRQTQDKLLILGLRRF